MFVPNFKLKKSKKMNKKVIENRRAKFNDVQWGGFNRLEEEPKVNLKPHPISDRMEDDSVEKIDDNGLADNANLLEERMKKLANLNKGVKTLINRLDLETEENIIEKANNNISDNEKSTTNLEETWEFCPIGSTKYETLRRHYVFNENINNEEFDKRFNEMVDNNLKNIELKKNPIVVERIVDEKQKEFVEGIKAFVAKCDTVVKRTIDNVERTNPLINHEDIYDEGYFKSLIEKHKAEEKIAYYTKKIEEDFDNSGYIIESPTDEKNEETENYELGRLREKDSVITDYDSDTDDDKTAELEQSTNFGNTNLMVLLDYIKNNKGSLTIKIEF